MSFAQALILHVCMWEMKILFCFVLILFWIFFLHLFTFWSFVRNFAVFFIRPLDRFWIICYNFCEVKDTFRYLIKSGDMRPCAATTKFAVQSLCGSDKAEITFRSWQIGLEKNFWEFCLNSWSVTDSCEDSMISIVIWLELLVCISLVISTKSTNYIKERSFYLNQVAVVAVAGSNKRKKWERKQRQSKIGFIGTAGTTKQVSRFVVRGSTRQLSFKSSTVSQVQFYIRTAAAYKPLSKTGLYVRSAGDQKRAK